jgi:two-component system chemotaxis response regulator CheY
MPLNCARASNSEEAVMEPRVILVVDSSKLMHKMYEVALRTYRLLYAEDGRQALDRFREREDVDLVITALHMPNMDGLELLAELRKLGDEAPAVVVVGSEGTEEEMNTALRSGAADSIKKPFSPEELNALIRRL